MQLSQKLVQLFVESEEEFPIELDDAWKWLGFRRKEAAKKLLLDAFEKGLDFSQNAGKVSGGRPSENFALTVDCFKSLGMMANTGKGREVRKYFLECERQAKEVLRARKQEAPIASHPTQPSPLALLPAPGWKPEDWELLPPADREYFSELPAQRERRSRAEYGEIERYLRLVK